MESILTTQEVARRFRVSTSTVTRWANDGRLASFRTPSGNLRFHEADVAAFDGREEREVASA